MLRTFRLSAFVLLCLPLLAASARAEEWTKSYSVGDKPTLHIDTNDAAIEVTRGASSTINARVTSDSYKMGSDVRVTEHQNGDSVELQVHIASHNGWGFHINVNRRVLVQVQVPQNTTLDLHSGDGHIKVDGLSGPARVDTGDGYIEARDLTGSINAHTSDGHITVDGVLSDVDLRSGDGHIEVTARPGSKLNSGWLIHTSDGRIEARLPADLAAELYAHTGDGHIDVDIPVTVNGDIERSRIRGKMNGGGPLLEISSGDGSIRISKY